MRNLFKKGASAAIALSMIASMAVMIPVTASAETDSDKNFNFTVTDGNATITGYATAPTEGEVSLEIPATVTDGTNTYPVVAIGDNAFEAFNGSNGKASITALTFETPSNLKEIGLKGFYGCRFNTFTLPAGFETIGAQAFRNCIRLVTPYFNDELKSIGDSAFRDTHCRAVRLAGNDLVVEQNAFLNVTDITNLILRDGLKTIGEAAFRGCSGINQTLTIPSTCTTVGKNAFNGCTITSLAVAGTGVTFGDYVVTTNKLASVFMSDTDTVSATTFGGAPKIQKLAIRHYEGGTAEKRAAIIAAAQTCVDSETLMPEEGTTGTAMGFTATVTNPVGETTDSSSFGTFTWTVVDSNNQNKSATFAQDGFLTLDSEASAKVGLIVNGLNDASATAVLAVY